MTGCQGRQWRNRLVGFSGHTAMQTISVGIHEAKTHLSDLLRQVEMGTTVVITRHGVPIAELRSSPPEGRRPLGLLRDKWNLPDEEELEKIFLQRDPSFEREFYGEDYDRIRELVRQERKRRGLPDLEEE